MSDGAVTLGYLGIGAVLYVILSATTTEDDMAVGISAFLWPLFLLLLIPTALGALFSTSTKAAKAGRRGLNGSNLRRALWKYDDEIEEQ